MTDDRPIPDRFLPPASAANGQAAHSESSAAAPSDVPLPGPADGVSRATLIVSLPAAVVLLVLTVAGHLPIGYFIGGIGIVLQGAIDTFNWPEVATILIAIIALVIVGEVISAYLRRRIL